MIFFGALSLGLSLGLSHPRSLVERPDAERMERARARAAASRPAQIETKDTEAHRGKSDAAD